MVQEEKNLLFFLVKILKPFGILFFMKFHAGLYIGKNYLHLIEIVVFERSTLYSLDVI